MVNYEKLIEAQEKVIEKLQGEVVETQGKEPHRIAAIEIQTAVETLCRLVDKSAP